MAGSRVAASAAGPLFQVTVFKETLFYPSTSFSLGYQIGIMLPSKTAAHMTEGNGWQRTAYLIRHASIKSSFGKKAKPEAITSKATLAASQCDYRHAGYFSGLHWSPITILHASSWRQCGEATMNTTPSLVLRVTWHTIDSKHNSY